MPKLSNRVTKPMTFTAEQAAVIDAAATAAGTSFNQFVLMCISRVLDDFPLNLPGQGEMNQPEAVIFLVRCSFGSTSVSIERVTERPPDYFRRLYRADLRAAAYCVGAGWSNSLFNQVLPALEHDLALMVLED